MSYIVDRRLNEKNKSAVNRQRFLRRYREHIKKAVADAVGNRSITDINKGEKISIPSKDISEPVFSHGPGGKRTIVHPGNKEFVTGDKIQRPKGGAGQGGGSNASNQGEGMDDFVFQISQQEFLEFMFEDLELPNLVKKQLSGTDSFKMVRAGITNTGTPSRINIIRSLRCAHARRIGLTGSSKKKLQALEAELHHLEDQHGVHRDAERIKEVKKDIARIKKRIQKVPFIDSFDIRYNLHLKQPNPSSKAVMFCVMDVSGSMTQETKDIAKRFFILLYLFLKRNYDHIEVVFIRHHTSAKEVDEEEFFYSRETGGTIVSSALHLMKDVIEKRFPLADWNIYAAQASDGDNWNDDSQQCYNLLSQNIMSWMQYFSYIEIGSREHQALWYEYEKVKELYPETFAMQQIESANDIYPVFRELFQKKVQQ